MFPSYIRFLAFLALVPLVQSSGYIEIHLKSAFALNMSIEVAEEVYFPQNKQVYNFHLEADTLKTFSNIPAKFGRPGLIVVHSGPVPKFGIADTTISVTRWNTEQDVIVLDEVHLPFTGFRVEIKCDRHWFGSLCDKQCIGEMAAIIGLRCNSHGNPGCAEGWYGENCDETISNSLPECMCQNGGVCASVNSMNGDSKLICECPIRFEGPKCEKESYNYVDDLEFFFVQAKNGHALFEEFYNNTDVPNELYY
ncbi:unnamed protein product [Caenorhabditis sp. 36 PRJEB53466]|nr:unnamed protein product [Caenorhabditis sp. 36 PRJEB53466]